MLAISFAGTASAGVFSAPDSKYFFQLGSGGSVTFDGTYQHGGYATLSDNGGSHDLSTLDDIWSTAGHAVGTSLYTGVNLITDLILTLANNAATLTPSFSGPASVAGNETAANSTPYSGTICPSGCLGGTATVDGFTVLKVGGAGPGIPFPHSIIGIGGTATIMVGEATIAATGGPWLTGKIRITNVTTNVISMPTRIPPPIGVGITLEPQPGEDTVVLTTMGGALTTNPGAQTSTRGTVTLRGTNNLGSASAAGQVTLVTPLRIDTGPLGVGNIPGKHKQSFVFVPEPGTLLLLASGAAGLVLIGRRRTRK